MSAADRSERSGEGSGGSGGAAGRSPFSVPNVRLFVLFRVLFNSRFYYPIFTVLFLDLGLTLEQFLLLNGVWGLAIVLLEVPSGALADVVGRRQLVVYAGVLMVLEMVLLVLAPRDGGWLLFGMLLVNRVLSGAAEAAASGADEALAYDSLDAEGLSEKWSQVLERVMQFQSAGFVAAMLLGGFLYDAQVLEQALQAVGIDATVSKELAIRLPLALGLGTAILTLLTALRMRNVESGGTEAGGGDSRGTDTGATSRWQRLCRACSQGYRTTLQAGRWIFTTPFALLLIVAGFLFDSIIRTFITLNSEYYRVIGLPEAMFGVVGSAMALLGIAVPLLGRRLAEKRSARFNFFLLVAFTLAGLFGVAQTWDWWGLLPVVPLFAAMSLLGYFLSFYLNRITQKSQRATVLSFRGLAFNLAYALASAGYAGLTFFVRGDLAAEQPGLSEQEVQTAVFVSALQWLPWVFLTLTVLYLFFAGRQLSKADSGGSGPKV